MDRDVLLGVGLVLFVAGVIIFLAFNPAYISLSNRLKGYETKSLSQAEYELYVSLNTNVMPILNVLIAIGITLLLLGALTRLKKS